MRSYPSPCIRMQMVTTCTIPCTHYASPLYKQNSDAPIREAAQRLREQMQQVISKWGQWTSLDTSDVVMPDFQRTDRGLFPLLFPELLAAHRTYLKDFFGSWERSHRACQARDLCRIWLRFFGLTGAGLGDAVQARRDIFSDCLRV
jgi:hypothetical protein